MYLKGGIVAMGLIAATLNIEAQHFHEDDIMLNKTLKEMYPERAQEIDQAEQDLEAFTRKYEQMEKASAARAEQVYIIPVVFHILHENGPENISNAAIEDAMRILNEDFMKWNADTANVAPAFKNIIGKANIEFRLARLDPQGKPHTGIDRIFTTLTNNAGENSKLNPWPRNTYMNVWVVKTIGSSGVAGYTYTPSGANWQPNRDGIILLYNYFGSIRTGSPTRSRTLTHEVGHWLNLAHPWGGSNNPGLSSNCNTDDDVFDTPNTIGWQSCNLSGTTCGSLDNVQNYMEYSYCSNMFTKGQVTRMRAALNSGVAERNALVSYNNNKKAGVLDLKSAHFEVSDQIVCAGHYVHFTDKSAYDATAWEWTFEGGYPETSALPHPSIHYQYPGTYKVTLKATGSSGSSAVVSRHHYIRVNSNVGRHIPFIEPFEEPTESVAPAWIVENEDNDPIFWERTNNGRSGAGYFLANRSRYYGQLDALISPAIDISNIQNPVLQFKIAYTRQQASNNDVLRVFFSNDCGKSWSLRYTNMGSNLETAPATTSEFVPSGDSQWRTISINNFISSDFTENFLVKIEVENRGGNHVYIDDFVVDGQYSFVPGLEFPRNGMDSVNNEVHLDWKAVPFVNKYELQFSNSSTFSGSVITETKTYISESPNNEDTRHLVKGLSNGVAYYWRVRAVRGSDISDWSPVWSFTVSPTGSGFQYINGSPTFINPTSTENNSLSILVYPNPVSDLLTIKTVNSKGIKLEIFNTAGQKTAVFSTDDVILNASFSELPSGLYIVRIVAGSEVFTQRIVKP